MARKKLALITDTALYEKDGVFYGFGPVVREIEFIEDSFSDITWIGFKRLDRVGDLTMQEIKSPKVNVILLEKVGGKNLMSFFRIILHYPVMFFVVLKYIRKADVIHTRAPSHPALIGILLSFFFKNKVWWNKFAGNWNQKKPPYSYGFQRKLLKLASFSNVTINGFWPNQPLHCHSFENPCLTESDVLLGQSIALQKDFSAGFVFVFVGRLENAKGVQRIIDALKMIPQDKIKMVHFVGDGPKKEAYLAQLDFLQDKYKFHGFLGKSAVHKVLAMSHFFLLPSASEGFPKALAEAASYGVIPVTSNVGSISHYVTQENGFVWDFEGKISYAAILEKAIETEPMLLKQISNRAICIGEKFTFEKYKEKLEELVFSE